MPVEITYFKAYDIRGQILNQLRSDVAYHVGTSAGRWRQHGDGQP